MVFDAFDEDEVIEQWPADGIDIFKSVGWFDPIGRWPTAFDLERRIAGSLTLRGRGPRKHHADDDK